MKKRVVFLLIVAVFLGSAAALMLMDFFNLKKVFSGNAVSEETGESWLTIEPDVRVEDTKTCKDSDYGLNFFEPGNITIAARGYWYDPASLIRRVIRIKKEYKDICSNEKFLVEYSCERPTGKITRIECPTGCSHGACNLLIGDEIWDRWGELKNDMPPLARKFYGKSDEELKEMFKEGFSADSTKSITGNAIRADYNEKEIELGEEDRISPFAYELKEDSPSLASSELCERHDRKYKIYPSLKAREDLMIKWYNLVEEYDSRYYIYSISKDDMEKIREIKGATFARIKDETEKSIEFSRKAKKGDIPVPYIYSTNIVALYDMQKLNSDYRSSSRKCVELNEEEKRYSYGIYYNIPDKINDFVHRGIYEPSSNIGWKYVGIKGRESSGSFEKVGILSSDSQLLEPEFKYFAPVDTKYLDRDITGEMKLVYSNIFEEKLIFRSRLSIPQQVIFGKEQVGTKTIKAEYVGVYVKGGYIGGFGNNGWNGIVNPHEAVLAHIEYSMYVLDWQLSVLSKQRSNSFNKLVELKKEILELRYAMETS